MTFKFCTLFSGSSGNCTYIKYGNDEILIDAGKNTKNISNQLLKLGTSIDNIKAIFITHEHSDHISALKVLQKKTNAEIFAPIECRNKMSEFTGRISFYTMPATFNIGDITVSPFPTWHDSDGCVGYVVSIGDLHIGVATDTGCVDRILLESLGGCRYALIEANYDYDMLKYGPYPDSLKNRIAAKSGHLSNADCAALTAALFNAGAKKIALGHLSEENNTPDIVFKTVSAKLDECRIIGDFCIASRDDITTIAELEI